MKTLSIIIVNYNVKHFLEQTLTSVFKGIQSIDAEVFVVDNNSVDGSCDLVKEKFSQVTLIENKENTGFSVANNQAIRIAQGKYVLLLNPDTVVEEDTFEKCVSFMKTHKNCGGLGVKMVDGGGEYLPESKRGLPTPWVAFYKIFGLAKLFPQSKKFGKYHLTYLDKNKTHKIDVLSGAFMFMRKEALDKSGLLDEDYFMYGEDIDLSYRLTKAGYDNYYYPETSIIHYKGESTKKSSVNYVFVFYNAMIIFAKKHFSSSNAGLYTLLIKFAIYLRAFISIAARFTRKISWAVFDAFSIFIGMYFLKTYWENNHKWVEFEYPPEYTYIAIPIYIIVWLTFTYFSGGYDKPFKILKVIWGIVLGMFFISAVSNFVDAFRFSKALIVLGSAYSLFSIIFSRIFVHFIKHKNLNISDSLNKKVALVGSDNETRRIEKVLQETQNKVNMIGSISIDESKNESTIGNINNLSELVEIYRLDELIFCAKDLSAGQIIKWMTTISRKDIEYKIVPDDSNFIIGSSSKNTQGDYYTFDIELNINSSENRRLKRLLDILLSLILILIFPFLIFTPLLFFTKNKFTNFKHSFSVLFGKKTWVGFSKNATTNLPSLKEGIYSPTSKINTNLDEQTINRLNLIYAKDYSIKQDLEIIIKNI